MVLFKETLKTLNGSVIYRLVTIRVYNISVHPGVPINILINLFYGLSFLTFLKLLQIGFSAAKTGEETGPMPQ